MRWDDTSPGQDFRVVDAVRSRRTRVVSSGGESVATATFDTGAEGSGLELRGVAGVLHLLPRASGGTVALEKVGTERELIRLAAQRRAGSFFWAHLFFDLRIRHRRKSAGGGGGDASEYPASRNYLVMLPSVIEQRRPCAAPPLFFWLPLPDGTAAKPTCRTSGQVQLGQPAPRRHGCAADLAAQRAAQGRGVSSDHRRLARRGSAMAVYRLPTLAGGGQLRVREAQHDKRRWRDTCMATRTVHSESTAERALDVGYSVPTWVIDLQPCTAATFPVVATPGAERSDVQGGRLGLRPGTARNDYSGAECYCPGFH